MTNCQNHFLAPNVKVQTRPKEMLALSPWVASFPEKIKAYLNEKYVNGEETGNKASRLLTCWSWLSQLSIATNRSIFFSLSGNKKETRRACIPQLGISRKFR